MKIGKTYEQKDRIAAERAARRETPHRWFAWRPVCCYETGQWVWLEDVLRHQSYRWTEDYRVEIWRYSEIK